ncbi:MAG TPA: M48 family metalloprotease, partial [Planctomycetota bacterium]|nr:M48 family metalloprotease [Planctomycetota bacterium]
GIEGTPVHVGLVLFGLLWSPVGLLARVILNAISRRHEYEADRFAAQTTGAVEPLVRALKKLSRDNLVDLEPHALDVVLRASHPPMPARIDALRSYAGSASAS